jgi:hypothetical protein
MHLRAGLLHQLLIGQQVKIDTMYILILSIHKYNHSFRSLSDIKGLIRRRYLHVLQLLFIPLTP